jgi:hypothetical protein
MSRLVLLVPKYNSLLLNDRPDCFHEKAGRYAEYQLFENVFVFADGSDQLKDMHIYMYLCTSIENDHFQSDMKRSLNNNVHLLDLPDEILMTILKKLDPVDVLYSLVGVNRQLDRLACDPFFITSIDLRAVSSTDYVSCLCNPIFERFCAEILPRIHHHVKWLHVEAVCLERILCGGEYPQLQGLILVNLGAMAALQHLRGTCIH